MLKSAAKLVTVNLEMKLIYPDKRLRQVEVGAGGPRGTSCTARVGESPADACSASCRQLVRRSDAFLVTSAANVLKMHAQVSCQVSCCQLDDEVHLP